MIATICSSVKRAFAHRSLRIGSQSLTNRWSGVAGAGHAPGSPSGYDRHRGASLQPGGINRNRADRMSAVAYVLPLPSGLAGGRIGAGLESSAVAFDRDRRHVTTRIARRDRYIDGAVSFDKRAI